MNNLTSIWEGAFAPPLFFKGKDNAMKEENKKIAEGLLEKGELNHSSFIRALGLDSKEPKDRASTKEEYDAIVASYGDGIVKEKHSYSFAKEAEGTEETEGSPGQEESGDDTPPADGKGDDFLGEESEIPPVTEKVAKEYPEGYRAFRYHDEECPEGQIFVGAKIAEMEAKGWHD